MRRRGSPSARSVALSLFASLAALACAPDQHGTPLDFQPLVFPGEAELGGSAAVIISSNYVPGADVEEYYDLHRSRVGVVVKDANTTSWNATVRGVFPLAAAPTSKLAQAHPGAWAMVVLFDLPSSASFNLGAGPGFLADVVVKLDGVPIMDDGAIGSIRITGTGGAGVGGQPTTLLFPTIADLEPQKLLVRLRPNLDTDGPGSDGGFPNAPVTIAGIEGDLIYVWACLDDFEPATGAEAADAGIYIGPPANYGTTGLVHVRHLVMTYPEGFTLTQPLGGAGDALGQGPVIDIAFDRPPPTPVVCGGLTILFHNVYVVAPDGSTIADERGLPFSYASSPLFTLHTINSGS